MELLNFIAGIVGLAAGATIVQEPNPTTTFLWPAAGVGVLAGVGGALINSSSSTAGGALMSFGGGMIVGGGVKDVYLAVTK
jgi:hypothetical protein